MSWVELHFHLLPGVDDGPRTVQESLELATAAVRDGTGTVVVTPHVHPDSFTDPEEIAERTRRLAEHLAQAGIELEIHPGGELAHDLVDRLSDRQLELVAHGPPGRRWVLLEAPFRGLDRSYTVAADELRQRGFAVVVAHPERAEPTVETAEVLRHERAAGSALQLNAWSLAGRNGEPVRTAALRLLAWPRVLIASDAHRLDRPPAMQLGVDAARAAGHRQPARLAGPLPRALLEHGLALSQPVLR